MYLIRSLDVMVLCVHMQYSMRLHSCLNTCLRDNMRLTKYAGAHACMHVNAPVYVSDCIACLSPLKSLWVSVWASDCLFMCVHGWFCVYVNSVSGLQGSAPYLALAAGGVQQVPNCCRPHNGFYKPGAGTGLWLSCRLGSPPLYPCRLHWRSSQSMEEKKYYSSVTVN